MREFEEFFHPILHLKVFTADLGVEGYTGMWPNGLKQCAGEISEQRGSFYFKWSDFSE